MRKKVEQRKKTHCPGCPCVWKVTRRRWAEGGRRVRAHGRDVAEVVQSVCDSTLYLRVENKVAVSKHRAKCGCVAYGKQ